MAHMIEEVNGQAAMAFVGDRKAIWHGLGTQLEDGVSPQEMMKAAQLDWTVEKKKILVDQVGVLKGKKALVRSSDNKILDVVGKGWNPVQNEQAFEFFNEFCERGSMKMSTAGSLNDGKRVWALAKVEDDFELFGGDKVEGYMLFSNPHQFGQAIDVRFTPIRVVCNNTLTFALNKEAQTGVKMSHRQVFDANTVKEMLGVSHEYMTQYKEAAAHLGSRRITDEQYKEFLSKVLGESKFEDKLTRTAQAAYDVFETQPGAEFARGTWWQALNSVTYVVDHKVGRSDNNRLNSAWYGAGRLKKNKAMKTALEMA